MFLILKNHDIQKSKTEIFRYDMFHWTHKFWPQFDLVFLAQWYSVGLMIWGSQVRIPVGTEIFFYLFLVKTRYFLKVYLISICYVSSLLFHLSCTLRQKNIGTICRLLQVAHAYFKQNFQLWNKHERPVIVETGICIKCT